jgi:predicted ester cyclase
MQELVSPKHRFCFPHKPSLDWNGHRELLSSVYSTAIPDFRLDIEEMIAGGNKVIVRMTCTDTHTELTFRAFR